MRILIITNTFPCSSETFIANHIDGLAARGHSVTVLAKRAEHGVGFPVRGSVEVLYCAPRLARLAPFALAMSCALYALRHPLRFARVIGELNEHHDFAALQVLSKATALAKRPFEVVHCEFGPLGNAALVLRICGAITGPILTSFRGSDISTYPKRKPRVYALLKKKGTAFLPVCDAFNPLLIGMGFPKERIATYRSSISLEAFPLRPFVPMARNSVSLLCVGRFVAKKGFEHAISVTSRLRSKGIQARLILIGDGPERAALQATAERAGISSFVDMPGWIRHEEIASSLRDCDVFLGTSVTPSSGELEGIPNVLKEAMAVGVPIVAFDHSGVREIVIDGKTGHLVPERDEEAMVERIDRLLKDSTERERIILAARRFVEETYGRESLAKAAEAIYSSFTDDKLPDGYHGKQ